MKVFAWRIFRRGLPTKDRLLEKRVLVSDGCYLCQGEEETLHHILFNCPFSRTMLAGIGLEDQLPSFTGPTWIDKLSYGFSKLTREQLDKLIYLWFAI